MLLLLFISVLQNSDYLSALSSGSFQNTAIIIIKDYLILVVNKWRTFCFQYTSALSFIPASLCLGVSHCDSIDL